eukprot:461792_1
MAFRDKKIKNWSNKDVATWIKSIGLSQAWQSTAVTAIEESECSGQDWISAVKGKDDIKSSFSIKNAMLAAKIWRAFKKIKDEQTKKAAKKAVAGLGGAVEVRLDNDDEKTFELNVFGQNKYWNFKDKVSENTLVRTVKQLYKNESGVVSTLENISLYAKGKIMPPEKTLGQCLIKDERHLITVKFAALGGERITHNHVIMQ